METLRVRIGCHLIRGWPEGRELTPWRLEDFGPVLARVVDLPGARRRVRKPAYAAQVKTHLLQFCPQLIREVIANASDQTHIFCPHSHAGGSMRGRTAQDAGQRPPVAGDDIVDNDGADRDKHRPSVCSAPGT